MTDQMLPPEPGRSASPGAVPPEWTPPAHEPRPRNRLGVIGFALSMLGFVTCGIAGMAGAIISAAALRQKPRALAIAGVIIGLLQLCLITPLTLALLLPALAKARERAREVKVELELLRYQMAIEAMQAHQPERRSRRPIPGATRGASASIPSRNAPASRARGAMAASTPMTTCAARRRQEANPRMTHTAHDGRARRS
jgi:hypothetical protein